MTKSAKSNKGGSPRRYISKLTLKVLYTLSGDQCAHPDCTNSIIEPATEKSDALIKAQICHILAVSEKGPRGRPGLTTKELNSPENLILLCRDHHAVIDGQHESYPADMLKDWKKDHQEKVQRILSAGLDGVQPEVFSHSYFPTALVDQRIESEVTLLRKSRFFVEFDSVKAVLPLGRRLVETELSGGSDEARCWALGWCARLLSRSDALDKAEEFLELAKTLGTSQEIDHAEALIASQKGNKSKSLQILARLDSPASQSVALIVVEHHEGANDAIKWVEQTDLKAIDLDSDGKFVFLANQLKQAQWEAGKDTLAAITEHDFEESSVLHHLAGLTKLLGTVPEELRREVFEQVPFEAMSYPLSFDRDSIESRREAHFHFKSVVDAAQKLEFPRAARIADEYALWLELMDPDRADSGKSRLKAKLHDPKSALAFVHLALQCGIKVDYEKIEREIEREIAKNGELTMDAARARFALASMQETPAEAVEYLACHHNQLSKFFNRNFLLSHQIELSFRAGLPERAGKYLNELSRNGSSDEEKTRIRRMFVEAKEEDPVEVWKQQYSRTESLVDLLNLVNKLEIHQKWNELCNYGRQLFDKTGSLQDADRLTKALSATCRFESLIEFLEANSDLLPQSINLRMSYAWALYYEGELNSARTELDQLNYQSELPMFRALHVILAIAIGDWNLLSSYLVNEHQQRNNRSAEELMGAAQLALHLESPLARDIVCAAVAKAGGNATIFASAYFLAVNANWEEGPLVTEWLEKAAELSGESGPLRRTSPQEILDMKPEWDQRESEVWKLLAQGKIPIYLAAQSLNRSLVDLTMFPALANLSEGDPRRRAAIPGYSGSRQQVTLNTDKTSVGIEATALLTLTFLGILDRALDAFEEVYIPHSTLSWLFEERHKATFHQPSQFRKAHKLRDLIATEVLEKLIPSTVPSSDLSYQVGDELAALIAEAENVKHDDNTQRFVVRPAPVHRLSTLMEEEADLSSHAAVLSSCLAVVEKLRLKGAITAADVQRARAYLHLQEKLWPNQPEISDGAILYLDGLAVTHLLHLEMLGKLKAAGMRPVVSPKEVSESNALITYEASTIKVKEAIECLRASLKRRIESGKVKVGRQRNFDGNEEQPYSEHPTLGLIALAPNCQALVADDRFINQHLQVSEDGSEVPTFTTLDLIDTFVSAGAISEHERLECRSRLRGAGYHFVPVREEELSQHLENSAIQNGKVIEIAELKAIRESILCARMGHWLQLPGEAPWLDNTFLGYIRVLKNLWNDGANVAEATVRSNWIADQLDVRGWAHRLEPENSAHLLLNGRGDYIIPLLTPPASTEKNIVDAYWRWVEKRILEPVKEQFPELYDWLVDWHERTVNEIDQALVTEQTVS